MGQRSEVRGQRSGGDLFAAVIGHQNARERVRRMLANGRVPHAVLFHGPRHVGKRTVALALARALLGAEPSGHPDLRLVERGRDAKTGKLKKLISVEDVRELREHLRLTSLMGGRKVAILDDAELLSDGAANALLKTLEEPPPGTHILLVAHDAGRLLPTVRSRCVELPFARVPDRALRAALTAGGVDPSRAEALVRYAGGRPGVALALRDDPDMLHWYEEQERAWRAIRREPLHRRFSLLAALAPPKEDREETASRIVEVLAFWEVLLRGELRRGSSDAARLLRLLGDLRAALGINVQPRLLLERFALHLEGQTSNVKSQMPV